jgi:hypothetical protein
MKVYRCKLAYFSGLRLTLAPRWRDDYGPAQEMGQQGEGEAALADAFSQCAAEGGRMWPGDVVELDDGSRYRCEMSGWTRIEDA